MAGPGGGPPRKSHTKSRKGCRTCKKRHIRCDEDFPQCRNCSKHSVRCDYMDMAQAGDEPLKGSRPPELLMSPELQHVLDSWRLTGEPPLPELRTTDPNYWTQFSTIDLRLIHHITITSFDLYRRGYASCTAWASKMPNLISVALSTDFTMSALLALSASQLAWQTKNSDTENLAYYHRGVAIKGLHESIGTFSEHNSDAILAASILLSWQATEWSSWQSLQNGIESVMKMMRPWLHKSELARFMESQRVLARAKMPLTPSLSGLPPSNPSQEDVHRLERVIAALHNLRTRLSNHEELVTHIDDLLEWLEQLQDEVPFRDPEAAFEQLLQFRSLLFWLPASLLRPGESDLGAISLLSHFFALGLVLEPLLSEIWGMYLGNLCLGPLENMQEMLQLRRNSLSHDASLQVALSLTEFPMQIAQAYKVGRRNISQPLDGYRYSPQPTMGHLSSHSVHLSPPSEMSRHNNFGVSPLFGPHSLPAQQGSYFPIVPSQPTTQRVAGQVRSPGGAMVGGLGSLPNMPYTQPKMTGMDSGLEYYGSTQFQDPYSSVSGVQNRPRVTTPPVLTSNAAYSDAPPPGQTYSKFPPTS